MTGPKILVCTVGGSDAPVVTAVRAGTWDHVLFVCTDDSVTMVTGQVTVPERNAAPATTRPSIPGQASLDAAKWSTLTVPADDPDAVYARLIERLDVLRRRFPGVQMTVDFTGGTKSMSAGAVLAVASRAGMALQVTTGDRSDLVKVVDGTQAAVALGTERIVIERQIELLRETWKNFGYQEAADGFEKLHTDFFRLEKSNPLARRLHFWTNLGKAFAAWDRFDRVQAVENIKLPTREGGPEINNLAILANKLKLTMNPNPPTSLVLFDLLRNAERCAHRGRYDDAVARYYRLWEWTVQWLLKAKNNIETGDVDTKKIHVPSNFSFGPTPKGNGRYEIGSAKAWELYRILNPDSEATKFWNNSSPENKTNATLYKDYGQLRNRSILGHGERPVSKDDWTKIHAWTAGPFMDMVRTVAKSLDQPGDMPQLPTDLPEPLLPSTLP